MQQYEQNIEDIKKDRLYFQIGIDAQKAMRVNNYSSSGKTPVKSKRKKGKQQSMVIAEEDQQSNEFEQNTAANDLELQTKKSMDVALSPEPVVEKGPSTLQKMETLKKQF
jgi:hypothetical protein